jgi:hypothetical protein
MIPNRIPQIIVKKIMTDAEMSAKEGEYFNQSHYTPKNIIRTDCDVYKDFIHEDNLLLKFRKGVISNELCRAAEDSYKKAAKKKHDNRGSSSGPLDRNKMPQYVGEFRNPTKFRTHYYRNNSGIESKHYISNLSASNIVGFFDRPDRNTKNKGLPCRLTAFNRDFPEKWQQSIPFIRRTDELFRELVPTRWIAQKKRADEVPQFTIPETAFTTLTINYSWRTAAHKDAGDYHPGFGNLIVVEDTENPHTYTGCYTGFPQYGVCVDVRDGDFLAMDVHEWHCNTEFYPTNPELIDEYTTNPDDYVNQWHFNRLSVVCYLREGMLRCKNL